MVAVPRRSQVCLTCRQRRKKVRNSIHVSDHTMGHSIGLSVYSHRVKCDLQLPVCRRCIDAGNRSGGYTRYPVLFNRTIQGITKRRPVEEVKRSQQTVSWSISSPSSANESITAQQRQRSSTPEQFVNSICVQPDNGTVREAQLISTFWDHYIPQQSAQSGCHCKWLQQAMDLPNPSPPLRLSLKALALSRMGWMYRDDTLVLHGRMMYSQCLQAIQKALYDEGTMWQDETLATGNILAWYEVNFSPERLVLMLSY